MRSSTKRTSLAAVALGLALGGCSNPPVIAPPVQETTGLLGNGVFRWICVTNADPTCGTGVFPTTVALGSSFDLEFFADVGVPDEVEPFTLEPVSPTRLARVDASLQGLVAGDVSVVALGGGYAIDYVPLTFLPIDDLMLGTPDESEPCDYDFDSDGVCDGTGGVESDRPVELVLGESTWVRARPFGDGADLAGAIEYSWESLTPELVTVAAAYGRRARLSVHAMGLARLSVRAGEYVEVFEYEVQEPLEPGTTGTEGESDGSETGSDSGTGSDPGTGSGGSGAGSDSGSESSGGSESGGSGSGSGTGGDTDGAMTTGGV